jgi:hypothetical protein
VDRVDLLQVVLQEVARRQVEWLHLQVLEECQCQDVVDRRQVIE